MFDNMNVRMILTLTKDNVIGTTSGKLPWKYPQDLKFFKFMTEGKIILMGSSTYKSIGKVLPNRVTIILSKTLNIEDINNPTDELVMIAKDLQHASDLANSIMQYPIVLSSRPCRDLMVVGGLQIYDQMLPYCSEIIITHMDKELCLYKNTDEEIPDYGSYIFATDLVKKFRSNFHFLEFKNKFGLSVSIGTKVAGEFIFSISENTAERLKELVKDKGSKYITKDINDENVFRDLLVAINLNRIIINMNTTKPITDYSTVKAHNEVFKDIDNGVYHVINTTDTNFFRIEMLLYGWNVLLVDGEETMLLTELIETQTNEVFLEYDLTKELWSGNFSIKKWRENNDKRKQQAVTK